LNLANHGGRAQDASFNITLEKDFAEAIAPIELVPQDTPASDEGMKSRSKWEGGRSPLGTIRRWADRVVRMS